jgi:hypothetical protein
VSYLCCSLDFPSSPLGVNEERERLDGVNERIILLIVTLSTDISEGRTDNLLAWTLSTALVSPKIISKEMRAILIAVANVK